MNTPKIRFKGFTDDWEQRKVLDLLVQPVTDGPHETPRLVENGIPFISVDAIVDNKIDFSRKRGDVSEEYDAECCKKYKPQYHDVYVVKSGSTVGKVAIVETTDRFNIWSPLAALRCEGKTKPYYLFYLLQTRRMQAQILDKASNGTQPNLSMRELEKFDVLVTDNAEEQQRIGDYFKSLDHLITLHQRKCDETKELKKYMLQKMFPKDGEKNPEIRFEGFTDDWEQRKFSDLYVKVSEKNDLSFGADKIISVANMYFKQDIKESGDDYMKTYNVMRLGDIAFEGNKSKNYAHGRFVENTIGDGIVSHVFDVFRPIVDYDLSYWKYFINNEGIMGRIMARCTKSSTMMTNLVANDFLKEFVLVPALAEQKEIGEYFRNLDNLITLHQRKCEKLKELKKFMLQNMFV